MVRTMNSPVSFIERHGYVKYHHNLRREYPCAGPCEISASCYTDRFVFDHCHIHNWVRGIICAGCNVLMGSMIDRHVHEASLNKRYLKLLTHFNRCPECEPWEPWITLEEYLYGLILRQIIGIGTPAYQALSAEDKSGLLDNLGYRIRDLGYHDNYSLCYPGTRA